MDKNEILEKSRNENKDEGMIEAENKGMRIGFIFFCILFVFMAVFNLFFGETVTFNAMSALFWAFFAALTYGRYRFTKSKVYLFTVIAGAFASLMNVINFVVEVLK